MKFSWKLCLIILAVIAALSLVFVFAFQGVQNKAIGLEEQITTAQSEIKIQEKRRADLIPNLVDCVKEYDRHEYETLMAVVEARGGQPTIAYTPDAEEGDVSMNEALQEEKTEKVEG